MSTSSTVTAVSDIDSMSDEDNGEDNGDTSDTASAPSPASNHGPSGLILPPDGSSQGATQPRAVAQGKQIV